MPSFKKRTLLRLRRSYTKRSRRRSNHKKSLIAQSFGNVTHESNCGGEGDKKIQCFREWCNVVGIQLNDKLYIGREGSCHGIGVIVMEDIRRGEVIAIIPRSAVLSPSRSVIGQVMGRDDHLVNCMKRGANPWIPLLVALTAEYTRKGSSKWQPYLDLVPNNEACPPPMLWSKAERDRLLNGTGVDELVARDLKRILSDYKSIVKPFFQRHTDLIPKVFQSLELFKKNVAFVMSYSFTDENGDDPLSDTMMVPFVDLLNHHDNHNVELSYHSKYLKLIAIKDIKKGEEVYNTFGQLPNYSLLHSYGFVIPNNTHDKAYISTTVIRDCYNENKNKPKDHLRRWSTLEKEGILLDSYEIGSNGTPDTELMKLLKVLFCNESEIGLYARQFPDHAALSDTEKEFLKGLVAMSLPQEMVDPKYTSSLLCAEDGMCCDGVSEHEKASRVLLKDRLHCLVKCMKKF